jgi:hypothetical protein
MLLTATRYIANFAAKAANGVRVMSGLSRETRLQIMLDQEELAAIDDWRFKQRMPSRASAIRELLRVALKIKTTATADPSMRSQDFGIVGNGGAGSED